MLYIDSNVLIGALESSSSDLNLLKVLLSPTRRTHPIHTSEITLSEVLVAPLRDGDQDLISTYRELLQRADLFQLWPVNSQILELAAELRSRSSMRLPDAIHVAAAVAAGCRVVLSQDKRLFLPDFIRRIDPFTDVTERWFEVE